MRIEMTPIGTVRSPRAELIDDDWGDVVSTIDVDLGPEALAGLDGFSHLEVVFWFHGVPDDEIETGARHPRGRTDWPLVGIFAQRGKGRPNRIGLSRCRILSVDGTTITVEGLDAVDGTPVLDLKPWMREFGPRGDVRQPDWATELMANYW